MFNKGKCRIPYMGWNNGRHRQRPGDEWQLSTKGPGDDGDSSSVWVSTVPWQPRGQTSCILGCIKHSLAGWSERLFSCYYLVLVQSHFNIVCSSGLYNITRMLRSMRAQSGGHKSWWQSLSCEDRLRTLSLPSLEKIRLSGYSTARCSSPRRENKGRYQAQVLGTNNTKWQKVAKLCQGRLGYFLTMGVIKCWNRLPSKVADALCLSVLKRHLHNAISFSSLNWRTSSSKRF